MLSFDPQSHSEAIAKRKTLALAHRLSVLAPAFFSRILQTHLNTLPCDRLGINFSKIPCLAIEQILW